MQERNKELEEIMDLMELMGKSKDPATKLQLCNAILERIEAMEEEAKFTQEEIARNKEAQPKALQDKVDEILSVHNKCQIEGTNLNTL